MSEYGIIYDEANDDYHANPAVSNSNMGDFLKRASLYEKKHIKKETEPVASEVFAVGSGTHSAVLEGITAFNKEYCILPEGFSTASTWAKCVLEYLKSGEDCGVSLMPDQKKGLKEAKDLAADNPGITFLFGTDAEKFTQALKEIGGVRAIGKQPLRKKSFEEILGLIKPVHSHPIAKALLSSGKSEVVLRSKLKNFSVQCRCDWWCESAPVFDIEHELLPPPGSSYACDLKTTQILDDWVSSGFNNPISKFGYDRQNAFYKMIINRVIRGTDIQPLHAFYFIVVEKQEPRECAVFVADQETIDHATKVVSMTLKRMSKCFESGIWPGFRDDIIVTEVAQHVRERNDAESDGLRQISGQ